MHHVVMFSSGIGSWAAAKAVVATYGTENTTLLFMDTQIEDDDNYRFLHEAAANTGASLQIIADGRNVFDIFKSVKFMGNSRIDPCSRILKRELADAWIADNFTPDTVTMHVGIDWTEEHRFITLARRKLPWIYEAPLCKEPYMLTKAQMLSWAEAEGLKPPRMYSYGFQHANCGGFCIKSGQKQFKLLYQHFPDRYLAYEQQEQSVYDHIGSQHPFLRKVINGTLTYLSMREFREQYLDPDNAIDEFDYGGCGCFSDSEEPNA